MKPLMLFAAVALLVAGCANHKRTCAELAAGTISADKAQEKLGLEYVPGHDGYDFYGNSKKKNLLNGFCQYYQE